MRKTIKDLVEELKTVTGSSNVYISPPSKGMKYPCIKINLEGLHSSYADNDRYLKKNRYSLTVIDKNPDSEIYEKILDYYPYCSLSRPSYCVDGLTHFVLILYF